MLVSNNVFFFHNVFYSFTSKFYNISHSFSFVVCKMLTVWASLCFCRLERSSRYKGLTLYRRSFGFYASASASVKTPCEKEKLLVTSNFPFFHSYFSPFGELFAIFIKFEIVVCKFFQCGRV